ncbi:hypothetical protein GGX14DRAFT_544517 [Mycena pura]|uniref:Uncharacterized protein n=1 Tax=Mycena pura TaxID=153505 RepID=A0AAD6V3X1_9AGAR|nr:hypothetical protein GGX14DRAFT_544517 [Mycena pura]
MSTLGSQPELASEPKLWSLPENDLEATLKPRRTPGEDLQGVSGGASNGGARGSADHPRRRSTDPGQADHVDLRRGGPIPLTGPGSLLDRRPAPEIGYIDVCATSVERAMARRRIFQMGTSRSGCQANRNMRGVDKEHRAGDVLNGGRQRWMEAKSTHVDRASAQSGTDASIDLGRVCRCLSAQPYRFQPTSTRSAEGPWERSEWYNAQDGIHFEQISLPATEITGLANFFFFEKHLS